MASTFRPNDTLCPHEVAEAIPVASGELEPSWQLIAHLLVMIEYDQSRIAILEESVEVRDALLSDLTGGVWCGRHESTRH